MAAGEQTVVLSMFNPLHLEAIDVTGDDSHDWVSDDTNGNTIGQSGMFVLPLMAIGYTVLSTT